MKPNEMAASRQDAIERCFSLGARFIEHFNVVCKDSVDSQSFIHHCKEMQTWWENVSTIVLKENHRLIPGDCLVDWFFTAGRDVVAFIDEESSIRLYEKLYSRLIEERESEDAKTVLEIMSGLLGRKI